MDEKTQESPEFKIKFNLGFFAILLLGMIWLGLFPSVLFAYWYFLIMPFSFTVTNLLLLVPLFFILYGLALVSSLITSKIGLWIVHKRIGPPIPGSYPLIMEEPQTRAFIIKGNIKNFGRWLYYFFHLNFLKVFWMRRMGVKIGKHVKLGRYVQDEELIELQDNVFLGHECVISGHLMDQTYITMNPTIVREGTIMRNLSGAVGGDVGPNSIFLRVTGAMKGQICRGNAIYEGVPCKKVKDNDLTPEEIKALKKEIRRIEKIDYVREKNAPIKISETKLFLMKFLAVIGGIAFGLIFPLLYGLLFKAVYSPTNHWWNILMLMPVPIIFIIGVMCFVIGAAIILKAFIVYYDRKADIPEGTYELNDPRAKYFKIKYFLRLFGLRLVHGTPFKIADVFFLSFFGNVKLGLAVKVDDAVIDPQYLEIGENTQVATGARIHTHDIINGELYIKKVKIGSNCVIGAYAHIKPGLELADGSVVAVAAWMRKNRKCPRPALWLGKPSFELPLEVLTKMARLKGKYVD